ARHQPRRRRARRGSSRGARRHRAARARLREIQHVLRLCGARAGVPGRGGGTSVTQRSHAMTSPAGLPTFRGPLAGHRPRVIGAVGGDPWLMLAVAALVALSVIMVFNISYFYGQERFGDALQFFRKHLFSIFLGVVTAAVASRLPSEAYRRAAYPLLGVVLVALLLVLVPGIGSSRGGARRWLCF